ncbi:hypothetical protein OG883_41665 [Streptomyces sp. NBC_01142]|uniref:hypothetical protein n=1 Tax=Streptomyces sp. NBC_01142 TaxID=2975865 RepID=UPI00225086AB|nr:hypothetical protein [Streptomyces sp. NBC_01142]MCX4826180.1 hypothetical protein [Streptomyces sp. NBC_01142]
MTGEKKAILISGIALAPIAFVLGLCVLFIAAVAGGAAGYEDELDDSSNGMTAGQGAPSQVAGVHAVMLAAYSRAATTITTLRPKCAGMRPWGRCSSSPPPGRAPAAWTGKYAAFYDI